MVAATAALPPKTEAPRIAWQGERGTTNFQNNDGAEYNLVALRMQRLARLYGLTAERAALIAPFAFGEITNA